MEQKYFLNKNRCKKTIYANGASPTKLLLLPIIMIGNYRVSNFGWGLVAVADFVTLTPQLTMVLMLSE